MGSRESLEINGYGTFGSIKALTEAIEARRKNGQPLVGEAELLLGATIVQKKGSIRLADPRRNYPYMTVRVGPTGRYIIRYDNDTFQGATPTGWRVVENP